MTDQDFLGALTEVAKLAKPMHRDIVKVDNMEAPWAEFQIDSLDLLMVCIYMCDLYQVPEEIGKTMYPKTPASMKEFLEANGKEPEDLAAALEALE